jgi:hypothetical protein
VARGYDKVIVSSDPNDQLVPALQIMDLIRSRKCRADQVLYIDEMNGAGRIVMPIRTGRACPTAVIDDRIAHDRYLHGMFPR